MRTGDSLQSISQAVWGDASLWYQLAEANGLSGNTGLIEGQVLLLPAGVMKNTHNAGTLQPYDPNEAIGDLSPTTPKPPKKKGGCGGLGAIVLTVVAVAVTALAPFGPGQFVANAVVGNLASQGVGLASGIQDKFNFKSLAMTTVTAGVGAGVGQVVPGSVAGSSFLGDAVRGAATNAVSQGVGVATGLQSKFDFAGVAAAGIGNGIGGGVSRELASDRGFPGLNAVLGSFGNKFTSSMASAIANSATRSVIQGTSFGDNLMRALPDAIGNTIGNLVAHGIKGIGDSGAVGSGDAKAGQDAYLEDGGQVGVSDIVVNSDLKAQLDGQVLLTAAGGDPQRARIMLMEAFGPTLEQASASAFLLGELVENVVLSGGGYDGIRDAVIGTGDYWNQGMTSFGHLQFTDESMNVANWTENTMVMDKVNAALAKFDTEVLRAGLAPVDIGLGAYNIVIGDGGLRDYLAVGGVVPLGKIAGALRGAKSRGAGGFSGAYATNGDLLQSIASRADDWGVRHGLGNGPVAGTAKHSYADSVLTRFQRMFGDRALTAETRYVNGGMWERGISTTGSIRLDVVEGPLANPTHVWDYKFGNATLPRSRINQIQNGIPNGSNVPILMVKP